MCGSAGDAVELTVDMQPQALHANLAVTDDPGRIAFQRGPIVYCMEQLEQALASADPQDFPRYTAQLSESTITHYQSDLLEGVVVLQHLGAWLPAQPSNLYHVAEPESEPGRPTTLRLIPCYALSPVNSPPCRSGSPTGRPDRA
jgi:uncharacterized protein